MSNAITFPIKDTCECECTTDPKDPSDDWHYDRVCLFCGHEWRGLHCPHDGYQNPCNECGNTPIPIPVEVMP